MSSTSLNTQQPPPSLVISLDQNHFFAGEMVSGNVTLLNADPVLTGARLLLRIRGVEKTFIRGGDGGSSDEANETNILLKFVLSLTDFRSQTKIPVGSHTFPFSFYLPSDLPGSFYGTIDGAEAKSSKTKADFAVYYTLKAYLDRSFSPFVQEKVNFIVARPFKQEIEKITTTGDRSFMFSKGKLRMTPILEKNVFVPGETFKLRIDVDNNSSRSVNDIQVSLYQSLEIHSGTLNAIISRKLYGEKIEGVASKSRKEIELLFRIKDDVQPTTKCKLLTCDYHLEIECDVSYAKNLRICPEIQIVMPPATPIAFRGTFKRVWEHKTEVRPFTSPEERRDSYTGDVASEGDDEANKHRSSEDVGVGKEVLKAGGGGGSIGGSPRGGPGGSDIKPSPTTHDQRPTAHQESVH